MTAWPSGLCSALCPCLRGVRHLRTISRSYLLVWRKHLNSLWSSLEWQTGRKKGILISVLMSSEFFLAASCLFIRFRQVYVKQKASSLPCSAFKKRIGPSTCMSSIPIIWHYFVLDQRKHFNPFLFFSFFLTILMSLAALKVLLEMNCKYYANSSIIF